MCGRNDSASKRTFTITGGSLSAALSLRIDRAHARINHTVARCSDARRHQFHPHDESPPLGVLEAELAAHVSPAQQKPAPSSQTVAPVASIITPVRLPFIHTGYTRDMDAPWVNDLAASPWLLPALFALRDGNSSLV